MKWLSCCTELGYFEKVSTGYYWNIPLTDDLTNDFPKEFYTFQARGILMREFGFWDLYWKG